MKTSVWPVIHLLNVELAIANADIAVRCGCEGVFVIQHDGRDHEVDPVAKQIMERHPTLKVGVNYLSMTADLALEKSLALSAHATWVDNAGVTSRGASPMAEAISRRLKEHPNHLFFGSVAFKYQRHEPEPGLAALEAVRLGMIPTTSGAGTGMAPEAKKLFDMRQQIGETAPLAVASGITPDNVYELGRFLSHILVATGVSLDFHTLDEATLARLVQNASDY